MPKPYAVSPTLRAGKRVYSATFRDASGNRVTKSLRTADKGTADLICAGLVSLHGVIRLEDVPTGVPIPAEATRLHFGLDDERKHAEIPIAAEDIPKLAVALLEDWDHWPAAIRDQVLPLLVERFGLRAELRRFQGLYGQTREELETIRRDYDALRRSVVARVAESTANMPRLKEALLLYEKHLFTVTTKRNIRDHMALARKFLATLPSTIQTLAEVRPDHIGRFLDAETARIKPRKPLARRRHLRAGVARLINWSAREHEYPSQMSAVAGVPRKALSRERGEIHWHDLPEVKGVLSALSADSGTNATYWRGLVGTLAYAGVQLAELCWLRNQDVVLDGGRGRIWVGPVDDPSGESHKLKTGNRERHVDVHPGYLLPLLQEYKAAGLQGKRYFFAMPAGMRRRARASSLSADSGTKSTHSERWQPGTLSTILRGHRGGKDKKRRPAHAGILPAGMTAASLRRTFGSLLLRSGKTSAQVAAAMGNTEEVVRAHYARLLGHEVDVDF